MRLVVTGQSVEVEQMNPRGRAAAATLNAAASYSSLAQKHKIQNFCKSLVWCTECSRKINRITQMDCKSRDESNESNYGVIRH